jgi:hypothetical protein
MPPPIVFAAGFDVGAESKQVSPSLAPAVRETTDAHRARIFAGLAR